MDRMETLWIRCQILAIYDIKIPKYSIDLDYCIGPCQNCKKTEVVADMFVMDEIQIITSNDRTLGCPIIYTDISPQCYFVHRHLQQ